MTKKLILSTRVWLVLPDDITLQWGSLIDATSLLQSVGAPAIDRVCALLPWSTLGCSLSLSKFGRSRNSVWALPSRLGALRWWWPVFKCKCVLGCQYYQTLWVLCSALGSDTRVSIWFSRNWFRHSWGRVLHHFSTLLAITVTEWGLGVYSWFMTSCALVRHFRAGKSLGWGAGTLNWCVVGSYCRNVKSLMRWCPCTLVTQRAEDTQWEKACGHRAGTGVLGNAPGWTSPHPPQACETRHFGGHIRSAWAWPCAARTKARRPRHHMPDRSRQRRATPLCGRPPAWFFRHQVPPFHVCDVQETVCEKLWTSLERVFEEMVMNRFWTVTSMRKPRKAAEVLRRRRFSCGA